MTSCRARERQIANPAAFWDRIAARYARQPIADEVAYRKKLEITRGYLRPDMEVLEFGCGTGSTAILHSPHVKHIEAIDISAKMLEIARGKADAAGAGNVTFTQSGIDDWRAADESYDAVLGLSILHLVQDREQVIGRVFDMLRPGGVFVTSTACIGDMSKLYALMAVAMKWIRVVPYLHVFTEKELAGSLTDAGFELDYQWTPGRNKATFMVAKKPLVQA